MQSLAPTPQSRLMINEPFKLERLGSFDKAIASLGFGAFLSLCTPGFDITWIAFVGLVPLLIFIRSAQSITQAAFSGFCFGLGYYLVALRWIFSLHPLASIEPWMSMQLITGLWLLESMHQSILYSSFAALVAALPLRAGWLPHFRRPFFPYLISVPIIWTFLYWTIGTSPWFLGLPINALAYSQSQQLPFIQLARLLGPASIDFLIVLVNAGIAGIFFSSLSWVTPYESRVDRLSVKGGMVADLVVSLSLAGLANYYGQEVLNRSPLLDTFEFTRAQAASSAMAPLVPIAVVQPATDNTKSKESAANSNKPNIAKQEPPADESILSQIKGVGVPLVVLPEAITGSNSLRPVLEQKLNYLAHYEKKEIITGFVEKLPQGLVGGTKLLGYGSKPENFYVKRRLLPFDEYLPLNFISHIMLSEERDRFMPPTLISVNSTNLLRSSWGNIGVLICLEVLYPNMATLETRHGAALLVNNMDLSFCHNNLLARQLLACATFRAIENGRYLVIASNPGISAVINPHGQITASSLWAKSGILIDTVQFLFKKTLFSKMWWL